MNKLFKKVKNIQTEACVSIMLNTHRTHPDNEQDPILLNNLVKEAKERLHADYDKRFVWPIEEKLDKIVSEIDHNQNLDSLVIYVNPEFGEYTRLSTTVVDRVTVDDKFATRDLIRASHEDGAYYILLLSRDKARLIEAYNDRVQQELSGDFPFENSLRTRNSAHAEHNNSEDNLIKEFFNHVDKSLQTAIADNPLPVLIVTESRNYDYYMEIADKKDMFIGNINRLPNDEPAASVVSSAWEEVQQLITQKNAKRIEELEIAISQNQTLSDYNEVWEALNHGRGKTLFVKKGFYQPALIEEERLVLVEEDRTTEKGVVDDIIDEMISLNLSMGGDVVFIKNDDIEKYQNLILITRY